VRQRAHVGVVAGYIPLVRILSRPTVLTHLAAFGVGYVLGTRAGRERYERLRETAQQVKDDPRVQQAAARAEGLVHESGEPAGGSDDSGESAGVSRLLADEHVGSPDEVVHSVGPDIEETVDELADTDVAEQTFTEQERGKA